MHTPTLPPTHIHTHARARPLGPDDKAIDIGGNGHGITGGSGGSAADSDHSGSGMGLSMKQSGPGGGRPKSGKGLSPTESWDRRMGGGSSASLSSTTRSRMSMQRPHTAGVGRSVDSYVSAGSYTAVA